MGSKSAVFRGINTAGLWLALAAMVLRLAMPVGWMPSPSATSGTIIVMCTMNGPVKMTMPEDGAPKPDPAKTAQHDDCPFGAAPHFATVVPLMVQIAPVTSAHQETERPDWPEHAAHRLNSPQSPRAPPLVA